MKEAKSQVTRQVFDQTYLQSPSKPASLSHESIPFNALPARSTDTILRWRPFPSRRESLEWGKLHNSEGKNFLWAQRPKRSHWKGRRAIKQFSGAV